jgi:hypothetical protein
MRRFTVSYTRNAEEAPMSKDLVFYTHPQSRGAIVHWMLEEMGCSYTLELLDYATTMKAPEYLAINPMGKVPTLVDGEAVITGSAVGNQVDCGDAEKFRVTSLQYDVCCGSAGYNGIHESGMLR